MIRVGVPIRTRPARQNKCDIGSRGLEDRCCEMDNANCNREEGSEYE